jgi:alkaline phosphatase D
VRRYLNAERWRSDYRLARSTSKPESPVRNIKSFVVENGRPGVKRV